MRNHRDLLVRQRAHALAVQTRRATRQFPRRGYTALQSQMVRAAESIVLSIVEGCASPTQKEFARFLDIAIKSASELEAQLELARDYRVLAEHRWRMMSAEVVELRKMLCGLRAKLRAATATASP